MHSSNQLVPSYQAIQEDKIDGTQPSSGFNSDDAAYCFTLNLKIGAAVGAGLGALASLLFLGSKFFASGAACPTNPIDPCDGTAGALMLGCAMLPGAVVGGIGGGAAGAVTGSITAPCVGFFGVPRICDNRTNASTQEDNNLLRAQDERQGPATAAMH